MLKKAFSLVELIVVITILLILAGLSYISFRNYIGNSRNSHRLASVESIYKGLLVTKEATQSYPRPDNEIEVSSSGVLISYQGDIASNLSQLIHASVFKDPKTNEFFTYAVDPTRSKMQIFSYYENAYSQVTPSYAASVTDKLIRGDNVGVVLNASGVVLQKGKVPVDLVSSSASYTFLFQDGTSFSSSGTSFLDVQTQADKDAARYFYIPSNFVGKKALVIGTSPSNLIENKLIALGFIVERETSFGVTSEEIQSHKSDLIVCDREYTACIGNSFNLLYDKGYPIFSTGNDSTGALLPIKTTSVTSVPAGTVQPISSLNHFISRGWTTTPNSLGDNRTLIESIHPQAIAIAQDTTLNKTEIIYLEEAKKGKWVHIHPYISPNQTLFKRSISYLLR